MSIEDKVVVSIAASLSWCIVYWIIQIMLVVFDQVTNSFYLDYIAIDVWMFVPIFGIISSLIAFTEYRG